MLVKTVLLLMLSASAGVFAQNQSQALISRGFAYANPSTTTAKAVTLAVPDFQPGDAKTHLYAISRFRGAEGDAASGMYPDEHGQIGEGVLVSRIVNGQRLEAEDEQIYLMVLDLETEEITVTLEIIDAPVQGFLQSLFGGELSLHSRQQFIGGHTLSRLRKPYIHGLEAESTELRFSLQGENMSIAEVLDALYQSTGCQPEYSEQSLLGVRCP